MVRVCATGCCTLSCEQQVGVLASFHSLQLDDNCGGGVSDDSSLDVMTTVFVHKVLPDGVAEQVGLRVGDKVFSIGGERVTNASHEDVVSLLKLQEEELVMVVCPKSDDVLQLSVSRHQSVGGGEWWTVSLTCRDPLCLWRMWMELCAMCVHSSHESITHLPCQHH